MASGTEIAKAYVQIIPTTEGIKANLQNAFAGAEAGADEAGTKTGNAFAAGFGKVISTVADMTVKALTAGATAIAMLTKSAVDAYSDYEQLVGGVKTLFGDQQQLEVLKNADMAYMTAGLSANEYMQQVTSFAAALNSSLGENASESASYADMAIQDMANNANKMGTSMESIQNAYQGFAKQNYTMLDNLKLGYGGTKSEMERLLRDAEQIAELELGSLDVSNFADIVQAINIVQTDMGITGATADEAATTISGSSAMMRAAWKNLMVGIADDTADFSGLLSNFVTSLTIAAGNIVPRMGTALQGLGTLIMELAPMIAEVLPGLIDSLVPALLEASAILIATLVENLPVILEPILAEIPNILMMLGDVMPAVVDNLLSMLPMILDVGLQIIVMLTNGIAQSLPTMLPEIVNIVIQIVNVLVSNIPMLLNAALALITGLAQGLINAIPVIVQALPQIIQSISTFIISNIPLIINTGIQLLTALVGAMPEIINTIISVMPDIIIAVINALLQNIPLIVQAGFDLLVALVQALPDIIMAIVEAIPPIVAAIVSAIVVKIGDIVETGYELFIALIKNIKTVISEIKDAVRKIIDGILGKFEDAWEEFCDIGENLIKGIWQGIKDAKDWLLGKIEDLCEDLWDAIKDFFDINSPSKEMAWIGEMLDLGLAKGIDDSAEGVIQSALDMTEGVMDAVDGVNAEMNAKLDDSMSISGNATLDINNEANTAERLTELLAMIQGGLDEINARMQAGVDIEWDDRNLGRLVQTYA
ncbi:MAG: phage tail protein [Bacteroidales bacterium]|nr:phage tail protein [Candidatus Scybalousia scybalohippi]